MSKLFPPASIKMTFFADSDILSCSLFDIKARTHSLIRIAFVYFLSPIIQTQSLVVRQIEESIFSISKVRILVLSSISSYAVVNFGNNNGDSDDLNDNCCDCIWSGGSDNEFFFCRS